MKAFVLCKLSPGTEQKAIQKIRSSAGVSEGHMVFGGWDVILAIEADTVDKLSAQIVNKIRGIDGISGSETLVTTSL